MSRERRSAGPDKAIVGNMACGRGRARVAAGFVAGCAHLADAGTAGQIHTTTRNPAPTRNPVAKTPDSLERRKVKNRQRHVRKTGPDYEAGFTAGFHTVGSVNCTFSARRGASGSIETGQRENR